MKKISKNAEEPLEFTEWKASQVPEPVWDSFSGAEARPARTALQGSLLEEQGHICCYCERAIDTSNSNFEHIRPRERYRELAFEYSNLLASCNVSEAERRGLQHCNPRKGAWYDPSLFVSPLDADCEECFRYTGQGKVEPADQAQRLEDATETIVRLGLNVKALQDSRKEALTEFSDQVGRHPGRARELLQRYGERDEQGRFPPFCAVIASYFRR